MRLAPFFSYYGSKHRIARKYPQPVTERIIDCFAGSAAYPCAYPHLDVTLIDCNPRLVGAWNYLIRASEAEIGTLRLLGPDETVDDLGKGVPQEAKWVVGWWLNAGTPHPCTRYSSWGKKHHGIERWSLWGEKIRNRLRHQVRHIRHWRAIEGNYTEAPDLRADWFVDPPYEGAGKYYGTPPLDYTALGGWCRTREGQTIVCENAGATWLPFQSFLTAKGTNGRNRSGISREVIWHQSDEPPVQASLFDCAA